MTLKSALIGTGREFGGNLFLDLKRLNMKVIAPHKLKNNTEIKELYYANKSKYPYTPMDDEYHLRLSLNWLKRAQEYGQDRGIVAKFSVYDFLNGKEFAYPSYPETSGYIINTFISASRYYGDQNLLKRALQIGDWLLSIQLEMGSFPCGHSKLKCWGTPCVFDTGQIILGLTEIAKVTSELRYVESIRKAADWMLSVQTDEGYYDPNYTFRNQVRSYYSRATYGLIKAGNLLGEEKYLNAAKKNIKWVIKNQKNNAWIKHWGFEDDWAVLHGVAYTLRGLTEAYAVFGDKNIYKALIKSIDKIIEYSLSLDDFGWNGLIPGYIKEDWTGFKNELCLPGTAQFAIILYKIDTFKNKNNHDYRKIADDMVEKLKCFQLRNFDNNWLDGGIQGSFPLWGSYQEFDIVNWGVKFFIDALLLKNDEHMLVEG